MDRFEKALQFFIDNHGVLRTSQALKLGIAPATLYALRDRGDITELSRGLFQYSDYNDIGNPDFVTVANKVPKAVIALISALNYYDLTTQIPRYVYIALPQETKKPRIDYPPLNVVWLSPKAYQSGLQIIQIDGFNVQIYDKEKTICDCFKFRHKLGESTALEALNLYLAQPNHQWNLPLLLNYASINRVHKLVSTYLKAIL